MDKRQALRQPLTDSVGSESGIPQRRKTGNCHVVRCSAAAEKNAVAFALNLKAPFCCSWHVKELLGHEHLDTLQHYAKLTIADLKKTHAKCDPRERES